MKAYLFAVLLSVLGFGFGCPLDAEELANFGVLPKPGNLWKLERKGANPDPMAWAWVTLRNSESGDLLSFASHILGKGEPRALIHYSDTAHEIFSADGYCADDPAAKGRGGDICPIRNSVVPMGFTDAAAQKNISQNALEYTYVEEARNNGPSRMAHGYVLLFDDTAVYVQHTSLKPITDELVREMATELIVSHYRTSKRQPAAPTAVADPQEPGEPEKSAGVISGFAFAADKRAKMVAIASYGNTPELVNTVGLRVGSILKEHGIDSVQAGSAGISINVHEDQAQRALRLLAEAILSEKLQLTLSVPKGDRYETVTPESILAPNKEK